MKNKICYISIIFMISILCAFASFDAVDAAFAAEETEESEAAETTGSELQQIDEPESDTPEIDAPVIVLDQEQITAEGMNDILVEGTVSIGLGQTVGIFDEEGSQCIESIAVGNTGGGERFALLLAKEHLHYGGEQVYGHEPSTRGCDQRQRSCNHHDRDPEKGPEDRR